MLRTKEQKHPLRESGIWLTATVIFSLLPQLFGLMIDLGFKKHCPDPMYFVKYFSKNGLGMVMLVVASSVVLDYYIYSTRDFLDSRWARALALWLFPLYAGLTSIASYIIQTLINMNQVDGFNPMFILILNYTAFFAGLFSVLIIKYNEYDDNHLVNSILSTEGDEC